MKIDMIEEAAKVLKGTIVHTPIFKANQIHKNLFIKAENLQRTGAFKLRGAYYKLSTLTQEEKQRGVIAASAGNHAQGVAYACAEMKIQCTIVMPTTAPLTKVEATRSYGVNVELVGDSFHEAYMHAKKLQESTGAIFIEPFNDERIIAGQGTIGLEILEEVPDVDVVFIPVGGGGLASGIAYAIKSKRPHCKVYGVQAKGAASMYQSLQQGKIVTLPQVATIADGIAVKAPGDITFALCKQYLDGILLIEEEEIAASILVLLEKMKVVSEGAGAVAVAAAMFEKVNLDNQKCVAVLSGANIDVNFLSRIIDLGLLKTGRKVILKMQVSDKPGYLSKVIDLIADAGANIIRIAHDRETKDVLSLKCNVYFHLETISQDHIQQIIDLLHENGHVAKIVSEPLKKHNEEYHP